MCGIAGFFSQSVKNRAVILKAMTDAIKYRGPDDEGHWIDDDLGLALGHRRLSIVDLSPLGHQPMESHSRRFVMVFNGEIYNFKDLSKELVHLGVTFRGHSDTEVMLSAFEHWGVDKSVEKFVGMFVFAVWDRKEKIFYLGRDRLGKKPLYYGFIGTHLVFASELKAIKQHPAFKAEIDRDSLALFMRYSYVPAPRSIYKRVHKLTQGSILAIPLDELRDLEQFSSQYSPNPGASLQRSPRLYWKPYDVAFRGQDHPVHIKDEELTDQLDLLLRDAVKIRMISDVPLGAFLSGGIDSSLVVALMQVQSSIPVRTFSIGFNEEEYNEAKYASKVAKHLMTDHTELYVTPKEAMDVVPLLPNMFDEPFADSSQIPTYLVSKLARSHVTVALSGDGGDELFGGYNRYIWGRKIWNSIGWLPRPVRSSIAGMLLSVSPNKWESIAKKLSKVFPNSLSFNNPGEKVHKLAEVLGIKSKELLYRRLCSHWDNPFDLVIGASESDQWFNLDSNLRGKLNFVHQMMYTDMVTYLPDDILVKVDRAGMAVSLEGRAPLLDHRVAELAWTLPLRFKIRNGVSKWALRQVLYRYVPKDIVERPKMGFGVPIGAWLRGPLRDWAEDLLNENKLKGAGFLHPKPILQKWQEHLSTKRNWQYYLWDVLMFQSWLQENTK